MELATVYIERIWWERTLAGHIFNPPFDGLVDRLTLRFDRSFNPQFPGRRFLNALIPCMAQPVEGFDLRDLKVGDTITFNLNTMAIYEVRRSFSCLRRSTAG